MEMAQFERLPTDVVPVNYKVELQPDLEKFSFDGRLDITAKVAVTKDFQIYKINYSLCICVGRIQLTALFL